MAKTLYEQSETLAREAMVDHRTAMRYMLGGPIQGLSLLRILAVAELLSIRPAVAPDDAATVKQRKAGK